MSWKSVSLELCLQAVLNFVVDLRTTADFFVLSLVASVYFPVGVER